MLSLRGTPSYLSPLLFDKFMTDDNNYVHNLEKSDVFSTGLTILYLKTKFNEG